MALRRASVLTLNVKFGFAILFLIRTRACQIANYARFDRFALDDAYGTIEKPLHMIVAHPSSVASPSAMVTIH